jgi:pyruvate dehydrogenase (quinone)
MKVAGVLESATELVNPDFAALAESAGLLGLRADQPEQVPVMIRQMLEHDGPALLEVVVNRQELILPPRISREQAQGFGLFLMKAVINGRGDEVINLAKTNLFR